MERSTCIPICTSINLLTSVNKVALRWLLCHRGVSLHSTADILHYTTNYLLTTAEYFFYFFGVNPENVTIGYRNLYTDIGFSYTLQSVELEI